MKFNRHAFRIGPGMRRGLETEVPLPTRLVSNEEFPPLPQTAAQREIEQRILTEAGRLAPRLGLSRRDFLRSSAGMAASFLAMNAVFGRFFDVAEVEAAELAEAIDKGDHGHICEELGDMFYILLLLILMHEEEDKFTCENVLAGITEKMIRRHPHVFSGIKTGSDSDLRQQWRQIKEMEKKGKK